MEKNLIVMCKPKSPRKSTSNSETSRSCGALEKSMDRMVRVCTTAEFLIFCVILLSLLPVFLVLGFGISNFKEKEDSSMVDDGLTTIQEMVKVLAASKQKCLETLKQQAIPVDRNGVPYKKYCEGDWDQISCWPNSAPGTTVSIDCPEYIEDFDHSGKAHRMCGENGAWSLVRNGTQTWVDYRGCEYLKEEELTKMIEEGDPKTKSLILLYTVGYSCSLVALVFAVMILAYFKRLHCTRNFIHMHLFVSFILKAVAIFVKDRVLYYGSGILDITTHSGEDTNELFKIQEEQNLSDGTFNVGCKIVMILFHYFVATNYYWILVEALYLHSLIFVAFFSDKKYLWRFTLTGWGVPVLFVVPWTIVRATLLDTGCWDIAVTEFKWMYVGPIVVANVINFLLFLNIIRVLWSKMRDRGSVGRTDNSRQYKKLAKSTLVLIPMFGVHAIVFIGMPDNVTSGVWWDIRMYFDLFFNSFQGFFVAIIYCFCNGEVQAEFRKAWDRFHLSFEFPRKGRRERSRYSLTVVTSFNSTASQGRLSIGGQSSVRGGRSNSNGPLLSSSSIQSADSRPVLVHSRAENARNFEERETSFMEKTAADQVEEKSPFVSSRHPFIRAQTVNLVIGNDAILPIKEEEEPDLEEALQEAKEVSCPAESFALVVENPRICSHSSPSSTPEELLEQVDEFDEIITNDESKKMREKRKQKSNRAASEDSGISSTSTFISLLRGRNRNPSNSNSDSCGDSEGYVDDDAKNNLKRISMTSDETVTLISEARHHDQ